MKHKLYEFLVQELGEDFDKDLKKSPYSRKYCKSQNINSIFGEIENPFESAKLEELEDLKNDCKKLELNELSIDHELTRTEKFKKREEENEKEYDTLNDICQMISSDTLTGSIINGYNNNEFKETLLKFMKTKNMDDPTLYNKVGINRKVFNKIWNLSSYKPCKDTIILLGIGLELSIEPFTELLQAGEYALCNNKRDTIIKFFIENKIFNIEMINDGLYEYNEHILGESKK